MLLGLPSSRDCCISTPPKTARKFPLWHFFWRAHVLVGVSIGIPFFYCDISIKKHVCITFLTNANCAVIYYLLLDVKLMGLWIVFRGLTDGGRDGLWWPALSGHSGCPVSHVGINIIWNEMIDACDDVSSFSTSLWCFCPRIFFSSNGWSLGIDSNFNPYLIMDELPIHTRIKVNP